MLRESQLTYSQFGEDLIVGHLFNQLGIIQPSYLDVGANEPRYISNTYLFYTKGSRGVLIEPNPRLCEKLRKHRPGDVVLNAGVGLSESEAEFYVFPDFANGLSTFSKEEALHWETVGMQGLGKIPVQKVMRVPLITIDRIFKEYFPDRAPHFMSVDVEGLDLDVLKRLDFAASRPEVICVETLAYDDQQRSYKLADTMDFMTSRDYGVYADTRVNTIFVQKKLFRT